MSAHPSMGDGHTDVTVAIATYDRPASLAETLRSCLGQTNALGLTIEILVVDNHPSASGRAVVDSLAGDAFPIRYVADLTRNMSTLRNRAFAEAHGEMVAIIDDDEIAADDWLDQLVAALRETAADIAVGPRLARFADGAPSYDPDGAYFIRDLKLADRTLISLTAPSGKPRYGLGTGNSLFRMNNCFPAGETAMRESFGDAGGEDAELMARLYRNGRRIVWAAKAFVTETVEPRRTSIDYRLIRTRRETQHYVAIYLDGARDPMRAWVVLMFKGVAQVTAGILLTILTGEFLTKRRIAGRLLIEHGLGKLTWRRSVGYISETKFEPR
jgi:succinoglycan biosynthesis protein ExoM